MKKVILYFLLLTLSLNLSFAQETSMSKPSSTESVFLRSVSEYKGNNQWLIKKVSDVKESAATLSNIKYNGQDWYPAIVPGTVLNSLVANNVYPDPYFGDNNMKSRKLIPDIAEAGIEFYHYWFRTNFEIPKSFKGKRIWLKFHGINYRSEIWVNGKKIGRMDGMFNAQSFDITSIANRKGKNAIAVKVKPVDHPGSTNKSKEERPGAIGENKNGGDGEIGRNVTMLMSAGWDFTAPDGIRDRNTGIWKDVELYATNDVLLEDVFVQSKLPLPDTSSSRQTVSVNVKNASNKSQNGVLTGLIKENKVTFSKRVTLAPNETQQVVFTPEEFKQLQLANPKLWWPINKGNQNLYNLELKFEIANKVSHSVNTRFGIREISSDLNTGDKSRRFYVNGHPVFVRGTNWIPEAMLKHSEERTHAELRYTKQAGINLIRFWGGGITESDYFYDLCDEMGLLVWTEFWITGDTRFPVDTALYFRNLENTVKRVRSHASSAYYVSANESTEIKGAGKLIHSLDSTIGYQFQSECCGIHDGSPYKYENPMQYFENTASKRGSRVDGFNPEYGTPSLPIYESMLELMPAKDLWPINKSVWDYMDGGGFHQMTTKYKDAVDEFGKSSSIKEFSKKAQFVGAMNYRAIWEVWNYNKFEYGDRYASGLLFWYHNSPLPQTSSRLYDWSLVPTAALYYSQNGLAPLHPQFDYLKNTVSVYNDYRTAFNNYTVEAIVYDFNSKPVLNLNKQINIPGDGVVNDAIKIDFPEISQVHFIKLILKDDKGNQVSDAFYWRSNDKYKGAWTMTGPAVSGFQDMNNLASTTLKLETTNDKNIIKAKVSNTGNSLSFFTELKLKDSNDKMVKAAFYSDNFVNLLPGESKLITIELPQGVEIKDTKLIVDSWNAKEVKN